MTKLPVAAGLALALAAGSALAADLPRYKAPPPPPRPIFTWTGAYVGLNIGGGFGNADPENGNELFHSFGGAPGFSGVAWSLPTDLTGVIGGGQIGYNYQFNPWLVVGLEADIQASGISSSSNAAVPSRSSFFAGPGVFSNTYGGFASSDSHVDWFGTVRGRIGFTPILPNLLIYGTGGFAYGAVNKNFNYLSGVAATFPIFIPPFFIFPGAANGGALGRATYNDVRFGWTAGGGIEYAPLAFPNWSLRAEYLYTDLGSTTLSTFGAGNSVFTIAGVPFATPPFFNAARTTSPTRWHTIRAAVNYRFNLFAPPVVPSFF